MTVHYNPQIVTNGLVLNLDAGNRRSYPGSGTIWRDLSGNRNNGILTNGPTFSGANGGSIVFDGDNDYIIGLNPLLGMTQVSIFCWANVNDKSLSPEGKQLLTIPISPTNAVSPFSELALSLDVNRKVIAAIGDGSTRSFETSNLSAPLNGWFMAGFTWVNANLKIYLNLLSEARTTTNYSNITTGTKNIFIGTYNTSDGLGFPNFRWPGLISNLYIYNRALSASEVAQNFNALRGRFGI